MIRSILHTFGTKFISAIINLLIAIIISQYLGAMGKGDQGLIIASVAYILIFSNIISGASIIYLIPRFSVSLILFPAYIWSILISLGAYFILGLSSIVDPEFRFAISILALLSALTSINSSILIGKEKIKKANLIGLVQPIIIVLLILFYFIVLNKAEISSYINALYISFLLSFFISLVYVCKESISLKDHSFLEFKIASLQLLKYGIVNQLAHIFQVLSFRMGYFWLAEIYTKAEVGIYSNAMALIESIWLISRSISLIQYSRISNTSNREYAQKISLNFVKANIILSLVGIIILISLPSQFFIFLFGQEFGDIALLLKILAPGILCFSLYIILSHYFSGIGKYYINAFTSFIGLLIALISLYFLTPEFGIRGTALANTISYTLTGIIILIIFIKHAKIKFKDLLINRSDIIHFKAEIKAALK